MKKALALVAVVAFAVAAYGFAAPYIVMHQLRQAAQKGDVDAMAAHVDYDALRDNMRSQVSATLERKMGDAKDNPIAAIGAAIGRAVAGPLIQVTVQPDSVASSLRNGRWEPVAAATANDVAWTYEYVGPGRFVARSTDAFVLVRHGFADWKLSEIRVAR